MVVGIFGIQCVSENFGVSALASGIVKFIAERYQGVRTILVFSSESEKAVELFQCSIEQRKIEIISIRHSYKKIASVRIMSNAVKKCDLIMDFTEGDSFSSIYGSKRYLKATLDKMLVLLQGKKLLLMPQTYGPFQKSLINFLLKYILKNAQEIFSRDQESLKDLAHYTDREITVVTDLAFYLPYRNYHFYESGKYAGFNISGLLWNGGYTNNNQFHLTCSYPSLCRRVIEKLHCAGYQIILFPHVVTENDASNENDVRACEELIKEYPYCSKPVEYHNPILAKSCISEMSLFIGSRMHATIGALSAEVPVIPLSYSKKFRGLFENLDYDVEVPLMELEEQAAVDKIVFYLNHRELLVKKVGQAKERIDVLKRRFEKHMDCYLLGEQDE